jgi:hypothetical protein
VSQLHKEEEPRYLANQLLSYLAENPDAQDTLEGIVDWWLMQQRIEYEMNRVKEALTWLVSSGLVIESSGRDCHVFYRVNQGKIGEIRNLIKRDSPDNDATAKG